MKHVKHTFLRVKGALHFSSCKLPKIVLDIYILQLVPETAPARGVPVAQGHDRQIPRRAVGARNARARLRAVGNNHTAFLMSVLL
jgi:hypothetical protein